MVTDIHRIIAVETTGAEAQPRTGTGALAALEAYIAEGVRTDIGGYLLKGHLVGY